jgi:hypothetical protein
MEPGAVRCFVELPIRDVVEVLEQFEAQVPGFIAAALVELRSGSMLVAHSVREGFDVAAACVFHSEIVKQEIKTLQALGSGSALEDILLTLSDQIHLLWMVDAGTAFLFLAADRTASNMVMARRVLDRSTAVAC